MTCVFLHWVFIAAIHWSLLGKDQTSHHMPQKTCRELVMSKNHGSNNPLPFDSPSPRYGVMNTQQTDIQNSRNYPIGSAPENSTSSPCRTPRRMLYHGDISTPTFSTGKPYTDFNVQVCGQCSNPGIHSQQNRHSPECSPISSSQMASPGPGYRIRSGSVTPKHSLSDCTTPESPATGQTYDRKKQDLPLPFTTGSSIKDSNARVFSSPIISPTIHFSSENPASPVSHWKKGKMIGRGTFGNVYAGFNRLDSEPRIKNHCSLCPINFGFFFLTNLVMFV